MVVTVVFEVPVVAAVNSIGECWPRSAAFVVEVEDVDPKLRNWLIICSSGIGAGNNTSAPPEVVNGTVGKVSEEKSADPM